MTNRFSSYSICITGFSLQDRVFGLVFDGMGTQIIGLDTNTFLKGAWRKYQDLTKDVVEHDFRIPFILNLGETTNFFILFNMNNRFSSYSM